MPRLLVPTPNTPLYTYVWSRLSSLRLGNPRRTGRGGSSPDFACVWSDTWRAKSVRACTWLLSILVRPLRDVTGVVAPEDSARNEALRHFQEAVERALRIATSKGAARSRPRRFVHSLQVISAREFCRYHPDAAEFVKIQLPDPRAVSQLAALLEADACLRTA